MSKLTETRTASGMLFQTDGAETARIVQCSNCPRITGEGVELTTRTRLDTIHGVLHWESSRQPPNRKLIRDWEGQHQQLWGPTPDPPRQFQHWDCRRRASGQFSSSAVAMSSPDDITRCRLATLSAVTTTNDVLMSTGDLIMSPVDSVVECHRLTSSVVTMPVDAVYNNFFEFFGKGCKMFPRV